jgi:hypothetical protein
MRPGLGVLLEAKSDPVDWAVLPMLRSYAFRSQLDIQPHATRSTVHSFPSATSREIVENSQMNNHTDMRPSAFARPLEGSEYSQTCLGCTCEEHCSIPENLG